MGEVRSRAGVLGAATGVAVLAVLPVVAFAQVPGTNEVVGGVTDTVGGVVEAPAVPAPPASPVPVPVPQAPAVKAPSVQAPALTAPAAPAPAPSAPAPAASAPTRSAPASASQGSGGSGGSAHARAADGRHSRASGNRSGVRVHAAADKKASEGARAEAANVAMAEDTADPLPDAPSPAKSPFTGLALGLLLIVGLCALTFGLAIRRATTHLYIRRATS